MVGEEVKLGTQKGRVIRTTQLGREREAHTRGINLKCVEIAKTGSMPITNHKAMEHINQSQGCCRIL